ncbi:uncharacterized protein M6B38_275945 [Iris pallida]|uniref:Uncharacterized protein n=1 Tax=Iris pallida TaxID=29817 RepID=A0AAX6I4N7_IRIPA|nr:uncharacterized protein M6B38_275945 [Iris pallida]
MGRNVEEHIVLIPESKALAAGDYEEEILRSVPRHLLPNTRPNSMVVKKVCPREFIPPHIVAEAISTLHGLDLRWSGPITPQEMQYVDQYVHAKYPQYSHGLIDEADKNDLYSMYLFNGHSTGTSPDNPADDRRRSPRGSAAPSCPPRLPRAAAATRTSTRPSWSPLGSWTSSPRSVRSPEASSQSPRSRRGTGSSGTAASRTTTTWSSSRRATRTP